MGGDRNDLPSQPPGGGGVLGQLLLQALSQISELASDLSTVQGQNILIIQQQEEARISRRGIHEKIDSVNDHVGGINARMSAIEITVNRIAPLVDKHETHFNEGAGKERLQKTVISNIFKMKNAIYVVLAAVLATFGCHLNLPTK